MARLRDDLGLFFVVLGVQHIVRDPLALEKLRQKLRFFDRDRADQHRLALGMAFLDLRDDRAVFARLGLIDDVRVVDTDDGLVRRDLHDVQIVDAGEFLFLGQRRAGHAGELAVQAEEILEGDGGERLVFACDLDALLGLDGLMQALVIPAAVHQTAGELVDDDDLPVLHDVVDIALHEAPGLHGLVDVVRERGVLGVGEVLDVEELLGLLDALLGKGDGAVLFVDDVVAVVLVLQLLVVGGGEDLLFQPRDEEIRHLIQLGRFLALAGDDERRPRLVDEDGVDLVDDGECVPALDHLLLVDGHVVTQVVEAELIVGAVCNVGGVGCAALLGRQIVDDEADGQAQEPIDLAHPFRVALGQIVVDRDDVHAIAGQCVEVGWEDGDEGFAFAGLHLGDAPLVQHDAAHDLHAVWPHAEHAAGRLAADREGLRQQIVERLARRQPVFEFLRLLAQLLVGQFFIRFFERHHGFDLRFEFFDLPLRAGAEQFCKKAHRSCPFYAAESSAAALRSSVSLYHMLPCKKRRNCEFRRLDFMESAC